MAIVISPNENVTGVVGFPVCFSASADVVIPSEDHRVIDLPPSGTNWTFTTSTFVWKRTGGTNGVWGDAVATVTNHIYGLQPFYISGINLTFITPAQPNRFYAVRFGVTDANGVMYEWYLWKNCGNQSPSNCYGPNTDNSKWHGFAVINNVEIFLFFVNFIEEFRLRSDGVRLHWDWKTAGVWRLSQYSIDLPVTDSFHFHVRSAYNGNEIYGLSTYKGSYVGAVETTWTAPLGGTITGDGNNRCFTANVPGLYQVCVESDFDAPVCVDVDIDSLYFNPTDFNCGDCTFVNSIVTFESNGGLNGTLTATGGTVIDALTWQAPSSPGFFTLTYSVAGFSTTCDVNVIDEFVATNVAEGNVIKGLLPGDTFKITTNYDPPYGIIEWENVDCDNIVQTDGTIVIPKPSVHNCFGALKCSVRARLIEISEYEMCQNVEGMYLDFYIEVDPVFPTPDFGGPNYVKWKKETPDYRVIVNEFEGGCDETYIRNKAPVQKWQVRYAGLINDVPCTPEPCCEDTIGYVGGYDQSYQAAARLDEFWDLVYGQYGYFTLIEPRTGIVWERVRFDGTMERDHINWRTTQSREFTLVWRPCCDTSHNGGTCPHSTIIRDNMAPSPPQNINAQLQPPENEILVTWTKATDNIGIKGYQIEVDGSVIDLGHVLVYRHVGLADGSIHEYRVRAYDFAGNLSAWTIAVKETVLASVTEGGIQVQESGVDVIEG